MRAFVDEHRENFGVEPIGRVLQIAPSGYRKHAARRRDPSRRCRRVLRELYALSDERVEFQIADRLSFQRFLGIDLTQDAPDYTAI